DYAQARYSVSRLARFSSPDPISGSTSDPQSLNRYSYVRNMPNILTDPLGLTPECDTAQIEGTRPEILSVGGPSLVDDVSYAPEAAPNGCGQPAPWYYTTDGGSGVSIDGGETFNPADGAGGILGNSESTLPCPPTGCQLDQNGNFIGPIYIPGHLS